MHAARTGARSGGACSRRARRDRAAVRVAMGRPVGVRALTAIGEAREVAGAGERIAVATAGGVVQYESGRFAGTTTWATGLATAEATAACALPDGRIAIGGADGSV